MTSKEKAQELVDKYYYHSKCNLLSPFEAKNCALIAVEEIKEAIFWHPYESPNFELEYWQEVKIEIQRL